MKFRTIQGGFDLPADEQRLVNRQRAITKQINEKFIQVGAVFLKPASKTPIDEDWFKSLRGETDLQSWIDSEELRPLNVGFNLQSGWMDVDVDANDPKYQQAIIQGLDYLGVDTRFKFGRRSMGVASHIFIQLGEDDATNYEYMRRFEPKEIRIGGSRFHCQLRSLQTNTELKNVARSAKQTVVPGSVYTPKFDGAGQHDISVWYGRKGVLASNVQDIAETTPRRCSFLEVVRSVAFGTIAYLIQGHWIEGQRQVTATKFAGWLARVVKDSISMNEHDAISNDVFCPIDSHATAEKLIKFICHRMGDEEDFMRVRTYHDAVEKLERNPDAKIPGWHSMRDMIGDEALNAMRTVLMPGSDVSVLTDMAERYVYDETDNKYIDRKRHAVHGAYVHEGNELERRHKGDVVFIAGKPREAFRIFESSTMRKRVGTRDMFPDLIPGHIYRVDVMGNVVPDEHDAPATTMFNTWKGWPIAPIETIDPDCMAYCVGLLDRLLGYLTRDDVQQTQWVKEWIAWIFQHPGDKQQIAWVVVGGMGVGKSFFGNIFMRALMTDRLWGTASPKVLEGTFTIGPFKDKMFVFIDEAKFHGDSGTDEIKKLIRNVDVSGMEKFEEARNYRIFSRIMFASNLFNMNLTTRDTRDRALFYSRAYDKDHLGMSELDFRKWAETLKPYFDEFGAALKDPKIVRHYIRYFMDMPADRHRIESIEHSSSGDPDIAAANMSWARRVVKSILESGWIAAEDLAIEMPFNRIQLMHRVAEECKALGFPGINYEGVLREMKDLGIVDDHREKLGNTVSRIFRLTHRWGTTVELFAGTTGVELTPHREFEDYDFGDNHTVLSDKPRREGSRPSLSGKF